VHELLVPILRALVTNIGKVLQFALDTNFCMGEWMGEQLQEFHEDDSNSLFSDGCTNPPHNPDMKYTVISFGLSTMILNTIGWCADPSVDTSAVLCVVYTQCELGLPTFALQTNGAMFACIGGNPVMSAATAGLGWVAGQAAKFSIGHIGFGVSLTGEFKHDYTAWNGDNAEGTLSANAYFYINIEPGNVLPKSLEKKILIDGEMYAVVQVGDGSPSTQAQHMLNSQNLAEYSMRLSQVTMALSGAVSVHLLLSEITYGALPDLKLGDAMEFHVVLTTQTLPDSGLLPGVYLYTGAAGPAFGLMVKFILDNFGDAIDAVGGSGIGNAIKGAADSLEDWWSSNNYGFGIFFNTNAFGAVFSVPLSPGLLVGFPLGPALLGYVTVSCEFKYSAGRLTCAVGYDAPKWIAALLKEAKKLLKYAEKFFGDVADKVDAAIDNTVKAFNQGFNAVVGFFSDTAEDIERVAAEVGEWAEGVGGDVAQAFSDLGDMTVDAAGAVGGAIVDGAEIVGGGVVTGAEVVGGGVVTGTNVVVGGLSFGRRRRKVFR